MLYLEELVDTVLAEEGQTLMGLDFLFETLELPMTKIERIFKKALSEYSERRPMKKTEVFNNYDMDGYITMPEGTLAARTCRYGILPNQMPRFYMPTFGEQNVEYDPSTNTLKVWPPITPVRITYLQRYTATKNILIEQNLDVPFATNSICTELSTMFAGKTLTLQRQDVDANGNPGILSMSATGEIIEEEELGEINVINKKALLSGELGTGTINLDTLELQAEFKESSTAPIIISYYPKYLVCKEMNIGNYMFTKLFASKLLTALASLRAQATQEKLHNIDLTSDELLDRASELRTEVNKLLKNTWGAGISAPV